MPTDINLYEISINELLDAYATKQLSPVAVLAAYMRRIAALDHGDQPLNSIIVFNPEMFASAAESAARWQNGTARALEGVPFTIKDSYMAAGLTVASGSPAFKGLIAQWDAFTVAQLKAAGAVLIGKTNMPPMADGGMQRGVYGRAENPYNRGYLASAYASGSSNGSGVAVASNFGVFGMGEETVSSGRSPASNTGLCAYTPSWGVLSIRGNWPLFPARDVVVPHTRTMADMLALLNVLVADDPHTRGDFWRNQQVISLPQASAHRPADYTALPTTGVLEGKTFAVPRMYLGKDPAFPMSVRQSILDLWEQTAARLREMGATVVETDFPLIEQYEGDKPGGENVGRLGVLPEGWMDTEFNHFLAYGWNDFLRANADPAFPDLTVVDPDTIFPLWLGTLPDRYEEVEDYENRYRAVVQYAKEGISDPRDRADFAAGLSALVRLRKELFEDWLSANGYDAVVFPANADIGTEDAERDMAANDHTWLNGVLFSNGNYALRHFGIPSVTVSMGATADINVPVGVTFAGPAYSDVALLQYAAELDGTSSRPLPQDAPAFASDTLALQAELPARAELTITETTVAAEGASYRVTLRGSSSLPGATVRAQLAGGSAHAATEASGQFSLTVTLAQPDYAGNPDPGVLIGVIEVDGGAAGYAAEALFVPTHNV